MLWILSSRAEASCLTLSFKPITDAKESLTIPFLLPLHQSVHGQLPSLKTIER